MEFVLCSEMKNWVKGRYPHLSCPSGSVHCCLGMNHFVGIQHRTLLSKFESCLFYFRKPHSGLMWRHNFYLCLVYSYSGWGMGLTFSCLSFDPAHVRQIRHNEVFSMGNVFPPCCSGTLFSLELQVLGLTLQSGCVICVLNLDHTVGTWLSRQEN